MISLYDKTVVLSGPFSLLVQTLAARLTELGADVALFTDDFKSASRVSQNLMDQREVNEKFGRVTPIDTELGKTQNFENVFSRAAELFGGVDAYIDTQLFHSALPFDVDNYVSPVKSDSLVSQIVTQPENATSPRVEMARLLYSQFECIQNMTTIAAQFLRSRSRTRILFLYHHLDEFSQDSEIQKFFKGLRHFVQQKGIEFSPNNTSINALGIGMSEEFLLTRIDGAKTIQAAQKAVREKIPHARIVDYNEMANFVSFILSPMSSGLTGQFVNVSHGL